MPHTTNGRDQEDGGSGDGHTGRAEGEPEERAFPSAASAMIAEMWRAREEAAAVESPPSDPPAARQPRARVEPGRPVSTAPGGGRPPEPGPGLSRAVLVAALLAVAVVAGSIAYWVTGRGGGPSRASCAVAVDTMCRPVGPMLSIDSGAPALR